MSRVSNLQKQNQARRNSRARYWNRRSPLVKVQNLWQKELKVLTASAEFRQEMVLGGFSAAVMRSDWYRRFMALPERWPSQVAQAWIKRMEHAFLNRQRKQYKAEKARQRFQEKLDSGYYRQIIQPKRRAPTRRKVMETLSRLRDDKQVYVISSQNLAPIIKHYRLLDNLHTATGAVQRLYRRQLLENLAQHPKIESLVFVGRINQHLFNTSKHRFAANDGFDGVTVHLCARLYFRKPVKWKIRLQPDAPVGTWFRHHLLRRNRLPTNFYAQIKELIKQEGQTHLIAFLKAPDQSRAA